ncbi:hypothetical protein J4E91_006698 [Alternaria rosae]|nr:hypothetical protein J4E91_006698 [Alternaria rosae]
MRFLASFLLAAQTVQAVRLSWYISTGCKGAFLYAAEHDDIIFCEKLDSATVTAESLVVSFDGPNDSDLEVVLYGDEACSTTSILDFHDELVCHGDKRDDVKAYSVVYKNARAHSTKPVAKRSPRQRGPDQMEANADENIIGSAKHYDLALYNGSGSFAEVAAIPSNNPYLSALVRPAISAGASAVGFVSLVTGCIGVDSATAIPQTSCALAITATGISFIMALWSFYENVTNLRAHMRNNAFQLGGRNPARRGLDGTPEESELSHEEYMESILRTAGYEGKYLGRTTRDGDMETPAYQFTGKDGLEYVYTTRREANDDIGHSLSFAHQVKIEKRQGYEGVVVDGGVDIQACQRNTPGADWSDMPWSGEVAYDYVLDNLRCLVDPDELVQSKYVSSDVMDTEGNVMITIGISPYLPGGANNVASRPACDNEEFYFSGTCVS